MENNTLRKLETLTKESICNKTVLVRADMDVSFNSDMTFSSTLRIDRCIPTISKLIEMGAKVVLITKLGKPEVQRISTAVLVPYLSSKLGQPVTFTPDYMGEQAKKAVLELKAGTVLMLENVRFYDEESSYELNTSQVAAFTSLFDLYVNEAFAMCHRDELSVTVFPLLINSCAGLNLAKEIEVLSKLIDKPVKPLVFVIGGAKIESKLPVINGFLPIADSILIGGKLVLEDGSKALSQYSNVLLGKPDASTMDISEETINMFIQKISQSKTVVWAGPMGKFEDDSHTLGTQEVYKAIKESKAYKVAGGGDTISAIEKFGNIADFDFVSTGGSAMLEFLAGEQLKAIELLYN